jgi:hypothetical protein
MRIAYVEDGKHGNKCMLLAKSAYKMHGYEIFQATKRNLKSADLIISYGNKFPRVLPHQVWFNIHSGYLGRPQYHRISVGNYHPGRYLMDLDKPNDRYKAHNLELKPWKKEGEFILLCAVSKFNLAVYGLELDYELEQTTELIERYTDLPVVLRGRKARHIEPLEEQIKKAFAVVTWSSNCSVEALIEGVPCFLRCTAAASPLCLNDLSRINEPFYPEDREKWLHNLSYCQFGIEEIIDGTAWLEMCKMPWPRGLVIN